MTRREIPLFAAAAALLFAAAVSAAPPSPPPTETVKAVDATRAGDEVLRGAALAAALAGEAAITIERASAAEALRRLETGKCDLAVLPAEELPPAAAARFRCRFYAAEAAICCVAPENPLTTLSRKELRSILLAERPDWRRFNGDTAAIHRYALSPRSAAAGLAEHLFGVREFAAGITRLAATGEALLLLSTDPVGISVTSWRPEFPTGVKPLAVDGVPPREAAIRAGSYPLSLRYLLVAPRKSSPAAEKFLERLDSPDHDRALLDIGWLPPKPRLPGAEKW